MKKFALLFAVFFVFVMVGMVSAFDESSLDIDITFLYNLEDDIFVGNSNTPIGEGSATVPLTVEGVPIIDPEVEPQNAGIHIWRGEDEFGQFVEITVPGPIIPILRLIKFDVEFDNAKITSFVNGASTGEFPYENPLEDGCGINEEDPEETESFNDEYFIDVGGTHADFCSATNNGKDIVRIYIEYADMTAPTITDITTDPELPLINNGSSQDIEVDFDSSEFPIKVSFKLLSDGEIVDEQEAILVNEEAELPVIYELPELDDGIYELILIAEDLAGNIAEYLVGEIIVLGEDPLTITNVSTVPTLPVEIEEGEELTISVDFESNKFPIEVSFELFKGDELVHSQEAVLIINDGALPVEYFLPSLTEGDYVLKMIVEDDDNNVMVVLGDIIVSEADGDDDGDDDGGDNNNNGGGNGNGPFVFESIRPNTQSGTIVLLPLQDTVMIDESKSERRQGSLLLTWIIVLLILIVVLIVLTLIAANR